MKQIITLSIILSLITSVVFAQETNKQDSTQTGNDSVEVVITPKKGQDSTIVKVAGMKIIVLNEKNLDLGDMIIDSEVDPDLEEEDEDDWEDEKVSHWAGVRLGVNGYVNSQGNTDIPAATSFLELDYARSVSWDLNLIEGDLRIYKNYVELVTGLGLHFSNYTFKSKNQTLNNTDPLTAYTDSTRYFDKNKLKATYLTAPLMIGFATNNDENKAVRLAFGGQVSWRIGSKLKQKYSLGGETYKPKVKSDFDLNPLLVHATASVGYGPINIYAKYGLNTLFEEQKTIDLYPFDVGIQLMF